MDRVRDVQRHLQAEKLDGWLLYDFQGNNALARHFLEISAKQLTTRRLFYWIPASGEPVQIVHAIETYALEHLPGKREVYLKWQTLEECLARVLKGAKKVAMEYSPRNAIPYISKVDAGTVDLVRSCGVEVVSSAGFLQYYTCICDAEQRASHCAAAEMLDKTAAKTWQKISEALKRGQPISEYDVSEFIFQECASAGFCMQGRPICGVNAHSADPHYQPQKEGASLIKKGDFVLIDLWCKENKPRAVYADISRVGVAADTPTPRQQEIFQIVRRAQKVATDLVEQRYSAGQTIRGCEVDSACRQVIEKAGYGEFFTHRTGHNIYTDDHGPGAHIDGLETLDERPLIQNTCFSIEPGIYLPREFGIRLEYDILLGDQRRMQITGGIQEAIVALL